MTEPEAEGKKSAAPLDAEGPAPKEAAPAPSKKVTLAVRFPTDVFHVPGVATLDRKGVEMSESDAKKVHDAARKNGVKVQEVK